MLDKTTLLSCVALTGLTLAGGSAVAQDKITKAADKPGAVPADVRARVVSKLKGANEGDVAATPVRVSTKSRWGRSSRTDRGRQVSAERQRYDLDTDELTATLATPRAARPLLRYAKTMRSCSRPRIRR
jgi:hypothetical protein